MNPWLVTARSEATRQSLHSEGMDRHAALAMTKAALRFMERSEATRPSMRSEVMDRHAALAMTEERHQMMKGNNA